MNQYLITGYDHTDEGALDRRMAVRPQHLEGAQQLRDSGNYILGGAILNDTGGMIGSVMLLQFETEAELEDWKKHETYIIAGIWKTVDVKPFKVAFSVEMPYQKIVLK